MEYETVLPRRVVPQPSPLVCASGDCGACCLAAVTGLPVPEVYVRLRHDASVTAFSWPAMSEAIGLAEHLGLVDRVINDVPIWPTYEGHMTFGSCGWQAAPEWHRYVTMAIDAGYYGIASIHMAGGGPFVGNDHAVLLVGARFRWADRVGVREVLVSCSARHPDGRWIEVGDFLRQHGGYNVHLVRPRVDVTAGR
jgi:hypothetical protein